MAPPNGPGATAVRPARRAPQAAPRPRLALVREASRFRPGLIGTIAISLVFGTLFVLAFMQAVLVQGQLHLDQLDRQIAARESERARLEVDVATAEAPQRIQEAAASNGLVTPPDVVFLDRGALTGIDPQNGGTVPLKLDPVTASSAPAVAE